MNKCLSNGFIETVAQRCSVKNVFLEISQNSQEKNLCQKLFFNKVAGRPATLLKKRLWHKTPLFYRIPLVAVSGIYCDF